MEVSYEKLDSARVDSYDLESNDDASTLSYTSDAEPGKRIRLDPRLISDAVLGLSDGMTVPFALTAGLSELGDTRVVVLAGLAELVAGAISMGLGGYLGAQSEKEIYKQALTNTRREVQMSTQPLLTLRVTSAFNAYQVPASLLRDLATHLALSQYLPDFLLRFEQGIDKPADSRAVICALTIATGYFVGGFIPLLPYLLVSDRKNVQQALFASVVTMIVTLFVLGYGKAWLVSVSSTSPESEGRTFASAKKGLKGGLQMLVVGGFSAGCAVVLVKSFNSLI